MLQLSSPIRTYLAPRASGRDAARLAPVTLRLLDHSVWISSRTDQQPLPDAQPLVSYQVWPRRFHPLAAPRFCRRLARTADPGPGLVNGRESGACPGRSGSQSSGSRVRSIRQHSRSTQHEKGISCLKILGVTTILFFEVKMKFQCHDGLHYNVLQAVLNIVPIV